MLYHHPQTLRSVVATWLSQLFLDGSRRHGVSDPRELTPHLQRDIGFCDGSYPFRKRT